MHVIIDDKITATLDPKVVANIKTEAFKARASAHKQTVSVDDTYQVVPASKRITADYVVPQYILDDLNTNLNDLRADLLQEMGARDVAVIANAKTYTDEEDQRTLTTVNAEYISNSGLPGEDNGPAFILKTEIADLDITYDTGSGETTASFQNMNDTIVAVENAQAGYTESLDIVVNQYSALATRTTTLDAGVAGISASIVATDGVSVGVPINWDGIGPLSIGMLYTFSGDSFVSQFLGGALGPNSNGWVKYVDTVFRQVSTLAQDTGTSLAALQSQIDGNIVSWFLDGEPEYVSTDFTADHTSGSGTPISLTFGTTIVWGINFNAAFMYIGFDRTGALDAINAWEWMRWYKAPAAQWGILPDTPVSEGDGFVADKTVLQNHIGDLYYDKLTGSGYRFAFEDITDDTPDEGIIFSWIAITDTDVTKALADAARAQATADGKRITFYQATIPVDKLDANGVMIYLGDGDIWIPSATNGIYKKGEVYVYDSAATDKWPKATIYTDDQYAKDIESGANKIDLSRHLNTIGWTTDAAVDTFITTVYATDKLNTNNQLDGVATSYFQFTEPYPAEAGAATNSGDTWLEADITSTTSIGAADLYKFVFETYKASGEVDVPSTWLKVTDTATVESFRGAASTKAAADRSIQNFTSTPFAPYYPGDTWMQGATEDIKVCSEKLLEGAFNSSHWILASKYVDEKQARAVSKLITAPFFEADGVLPVPDPAGREGDIWTADDVFYDVNRNYPQVKVYKTGAWSTIATFQEAQSLDIQWSGGSSKLLRGPDGSITGWSFGAGSGVSNDFVINADRFMVSDGTNSANAALTVDMSSGTPVTTFNGKVNFTNTDMALYTNAVVISPVGLGHLRSEDPNLQPFNSTLVDVTDGAVNPTCIELVATVDQFIFIYSDDPGNRNFIPLKTGDTVTCSIYVKSSNPYLKISIQFDDGSYHTTDEPLVVNEWTRISTTVTVPAGIEGCLVHLQNGQSAVAGDTWRLDGGMVEISSTPSTYTSSSIGVANVDMSNVTTIDGGKITTGTLHAETIIAGGSISAPSITGGSIEGVNITGAVIKASWIDYSSVGALTDWKYYGPGLLPPSTANFAFDNYGNIVVTDVGSGASDLGFYRLPSVTPLLIPGFYRVIELADVQAPNSSASLPNGALPVYAYDSYELDVASSRSLKSNTLMSVEGIPLGETHYLYRGQNSIYDHNSDYNSNTSTALLNIFGTDVELYAKGIEGGTCSGWIKVNGTTVKSFSVHETSTSISYDIDIKGTVYTLTSGADGFTGSGAEVSVRLEIPVDGLIHVDDYTSADGSYTLVSNNMSWDGGEYLQGLNFYVHFPTVSILNV